MIFDGMSSHDLRVYRDSLLEEIGNAGAKITENMQKVWEVNAEITHRRIADGD